MSSSLKLTAGFILTLFFSINVHAQEVIQPPAVCAPEFIADFDATFASFQEVVRVIEENADEQSYRSAVVAGLNSCHSFVAKYVSIDPVSGRWAGAACVRQVDPVTTMILEPKFHKAECEYLQRLLNAEKQ